MQIDWFTFIAQIVNFLILLALLKRFLYGPVLKAIDDRAAEIAARFDDVEEQEETVRRARDEFQAKTQELAHAEQRLLAEAAEECQRWKNERLADVRVETEQSRADWFAAIDSERERLKDHLLSLYRQHSLRLAEGILSCLTDRNVQELLVDAFLRRLSESGGRISTDQKSGQVTGLAIIRSAFDLPLDQQKKLKESLTEKGYGADRIEFRVDGSLICGLEIRIEDREIAWNFCESLDFLAGDFHRDLDATLTLPVGISSDSEVSHVT